MGVKSFGTLLEADPRKIEIVTGRKYPFGNHIKDSLLSLPPKVEMKVEETECPRQGKSKLVITLSRLSQPSQPVRRHYADMVCGQDYFYYCICFFFFALFLPVFIIFLFILQASSLQQVVGVEEDNLIIFHEKIRYLQRPFSHYRFLGTPFGQIKCYCFTLLHF